MIEWKDDYLVGIEMIDTQHRELFRIAGEAEELLKDYMKFDKYEEVMVLVKRLRDYTQYHFSQEEALMLANKYRKFFEHKMMHDDFIDELEDIIQKIQNDADDHLIHNILTFTIDWIVQHIYVKDRFMAKEVSE